MDLFSDWSKRRKIGFGLLFVATVSGFIFSDMIVSGLAFMSGTQDLSVDAERFGGNMNSSPGSDIGNEEKFWIQESYQDEIENLSKREYYVTQQNGTEPPFENELYNEKREGIYVDVVSGEPLFSSKHKFDSGTGWPSFYKPLESENIIERRDPGPLGVRVEIASKNARSHLGHLFNHPDTPTGLRYCMNSAALEFIPAEKLEERGYGQYSDMFDQN